MAVLNQLSSPGFEAPNSDWVLGTQGTGASTIDTVNQRSGVNCLKETNPSAGNYGATYNKRGMSVKGMGGRLLTASAWIKGSAGGFFSDASGGLRVTFANQGSVISGQGIASSQPSAQAGVFVVEFTPSITTSFVQYLSTYAIPIGYDWAFIELYTNGNGAVPNTYWDDLSVTLQPVTVTCGNRVVDPGFESGTLTAIRLNWAASSAEFSVDTGLLGSFSLKATTTRTSSGWVTAEPNQARIAILPNTSYTYEAWSKASAGSRQTHFKVLYYKSDGVTLSTVHASDFIQGGTDGPYAWQLWRASFTSPSDAAFADVQLMYGYWDGTTGSNAQMWFDGVKMGHADQSGKILNHSMTCKLNTLDFTLYDPTVIPAQGDLVELYTPAWRGLVVAVETSEVIEKKVGHQFVTVSAVNVDQAYASAAPFNLSDSPGNNLLTSMQASAETGITGWAAEGSATATQSPTLALDGLNSVRLASTASNAGMNAVTPSGTSGVPVVPSTQYTALASVRAQSAGIVKTMTMVIRWYKASGAASTVTPNSAGTGVIDTATGWLQITCTANSPSDAAFAQVVIACSGASAAGENHYIDQISMALGGSTVWTPGGGRSISYSGLKIKNATNTNGATTTLGRCTVEQGGLWPAMTIQVTSTNQKQASADFSVTNVSVTWPTKDHPVYAIDFGDPIVTMSVWMNSMTQGILPIDRTKITDGEITTPKLAANAVTADKLTATLILATLIRAGAGAQHIEFDKFGLRAYDPSNNLVVNIPDDGTPVYINAQIIAQVLTVTGNAFLQGTGNELALGSTTQLDAHQGNPGQSPSLAATFDGVSLPIDAAYDTSSAIYARAGLDYDSVGGAGGATKSFWTATKKNNGTQEYALELLASNRTVARSIAVTGSGTTPLPLSVCRMGSYVYVLSVDTGAGTGGTGTLGQTGGAGFSYVIGFAGGPNQFAMGPYTMPVHGTITQVSVDCGAESGTVGARAVLWDGSGNYVSQSGVQTLGVGHSRRDFAIGPIDAPAGSTWYIGVWLDNAPSKRVGVQNGGTLHYKANQSGITAMAPGTYTDWSTPPAGNMQAYMTYTKVTATTTYTVRRYLQSTLALDTTYPSVAFPITPVTPVLCQDGTNLYIVDMGPGASVVWQKYDAAMATVGGVIDTSYFPGGQVLAAAAGNFDFGAARLAVMTTGTGAVDTFTAAGAVQANEQFPVVGVAAYGLTYGDALADGARFWSLPATTAAVNLTKHSTWVWTSASSIYWCAYTWYDSNATGGLHETQISPSRSITMGRRQQLVITAPPIPGAGGTNDANNIRFYMVPNASDPGPTGYKLQATQSGTTLLATGYASGGAADPASNNFAAGATAELRSQIGGMSLRGDGYSLFGSSIQIPPDVGGTLAPTSFGHVPVKLDEVVLGSAQSTITFASISQKFRHLVIEYQLRGDLATQNQEIGIRFNGDSGNNYMWNRFLDQVASPYDLLQESGVAVASAGQHMYIPGTTAMAGAATSGRTFIANYSGTTFKKMARNDFAWYDGTAMNQSGQLEIDTNAWFWNNTAAITQIDFINISAANFLAGCVATLYGIP